MAGVFGNEAISRVGLEVQNVHPISAENTSYDIQAYVMLPSGRGQEHYVWSMFSIMCLSAIIFLLLRGHQCLRVLELQEKLTDGANERVLSVAESGAFKKCVESGSGWLRSGPGGGRDQTLSVASSGSGYVSKGAASGSASGAKGKTAHDSGPTLPVSQKLESSKGRGRGPSQAPGAAALWKVLGNILPFRQASLSFAKGNGSPESREAGISDAAANKGPQEKARSRLSTPLSKRVLLELPLDIAEHKRQLRLLRPSGDDCADMNDDELELLQAAAGYLEAMLKKRSDILRALHANSVKQEQLESRKDELALKGPAGSAERRRLQGLLGKLQEEAGLLDQRLSRTRRELKSLVPLRQQMALSLRLVAGRRAAGRFLSHRGAAALSAAILIVNGSGGHHFAATATEEKEIIKMSGELLNRMKISTAALTEKLNALDSDSPGGFTSFLNNQALKKHKRRCRILVKEASTFILQLRFVLLSNSSSQMIEGLQRADMQLRKALDRCARITESRRSSDDSGSWRSLLRRLTLLNFRTEGIRGPTNEAHGKSKEEMG
ncbi:hypothetical protein, conserved [Eimeria praecox]|uniref:Uncharacterized protein n=1 Tax=Eimeria praecox TaxID=51316 RepID=U6H850_9EIME|nr:hypothetical protein, conserved [Eimeria praecox]